MKEIGDILTIAGEEYAVIDRILYEGINYILTSKYENDEPKGEYIAFELVGDDQVLQVKNKQILEKILPIFSKNVKKVIDLMNIKEKYDIN